MKIICTADWHLLSQQPIARKDDIIETWQRKVKFIFDYYYKSADMIVVAGDIFDSPRNWQTLSLFMKMLNGQLGIYVVYGQHDNYFYGRSKDETSLGILTKKLGLTLHLLTDKDIPVPNVYGCSWGEEIPEPKEKKGNILVIHKSISDAPLFPGHEFTNAETFLRTHPEFDLIVCGDIHRRFHYEYKGRHIVNSGPLLRLEATEYNFIHTPGFWLYDTSDRSVSWVEIPHGPTDKVLSRDHIESKKETELMLDDFISALNQDVELTFNFKENLRKFMEDNSIDSDVIKIIDEVISNVA